MQIQPLTYISVCILIIGLSLAAIFIGISIYTFAKNRTRQGSARSLMVGLGIAAPTIVIALFVPESILFPLACISGLILGGAAGFIMNLNPHYDPWPPNPPYDWHNPPYAEIVLGKERVKRLTPGLRAFQLIISLASIGMGLLCLTAMIIRWLGW